MDKCLCVRPWTLAKCLTEPSCLLMKHLRLSSPLRNLSNHHWTVHPLAVPGPKASWMLQVVPAALTTHFELELKNALRDFPGGPLVKSPSGHAGEHGFDPWSRKIPPATGQLSPTSHNYWSLPPWSPCSATREATSVGSPWLQLDSSLHWRQLEKLWAAVKTQHSEK